MTTSTTTSSSAPRRVPWRVRHQLTQDVLGVLWLDGIAANARVIVYELDAQLGIRYVGALEDLQLELAEDHLDVDDVGDAAAVAA